MKKITSRILRILLTLIAYFVAFWFLLPPINPHSQDFWFFVALCIVMTMAINGFAMVKESVNKLKVMDTRKGSGKLNFLPVPMKIAVYSILGMIVLGASASLIGSQIFNASSYNQLMTLEDGDFATDVAELTMDQIPVVDHDTAIRLGQRKLGEISDLVSQFEIDETYTQINYKNHPYRVTPLVYGDIIKWFNNQSEGIPAYMMVNMTTQEATLVRLDDGIHYSSSEYFMHNIDRYLRFSYPTKMFDNLSFEIDEDGTPYWIASTLDYRIAWWNGRDISGAVLVNAVTGESQFYSLEDIPSWVDQVYDSDIIMEQLTYNGKYRSGFINSFFGQKGVLQPTSGYNYIAIDDDVYMYTGLTSVTSDESNVGFVLVNLRTKESRYYAVPGAEEYSAMDSAEGQVQNLKYSSTFPILLNVSDRPTYFMSLKDDAGLVKMYAFVDVEEYQIVGTGSTVDAARADYAQKLGDDEDVEPVAYDQTTVSGTISQISSAVVNGNTQYYILINGKDTPYVVDVSFCDLLPFAQTGDRIQLTLEEQPTGEVVTGAEVTLQ